MTILYNKKELKERRRELRRNQTEEEKLLWSNIRNRQLMGVKFFRQYSVAKYVLDFYAPTVRLAIEIDGGQHNLEDQKEYDEKRTEYLHSMNIKVLRFWNNELHRNINGVLMKIEECIKTFYENNKK